MAQKVCWGILSTAMINDVVIAGMRKAARSELVAVSSRDSKKAKDYAATRNIPRAYGSYEEMLADPDLDAVYISVPNTLHREWAVKATDAGKHVLCEKPLVTTMSDFRKVEDAATKAAPPGCADVGQARDVAVDQLDQPVVQPADHLCI